MSNSYGLHDFIAGRANASKGGYKYANDNGSVLQTGNAAYTNGKKVKRHQENTQKDSSDSKPRYAKK